MEQEKRYISVAEFARLKGVSQQAIYKKLNNTLNPYVVIVEGRKMLDATALELGGVEPTVKQQNQQNQSNQPLKGSTVENELKRLVEEQRATIEKLQKELEEARAQISHKDEIIENMTTRLLSMAETQQELIRNSQILVAQAQEKRGFFARLFLPKGKNTQAKPNN